MVYGCGNNLIKFVFFVINLLICIFGALIFGFSLWANLDKSFSEHFAEFIRKVDPATSTQKLDDIAKYQATLWVFVGVGAILFMVGFLGCCGAACESPILLSLFFFIVAVCTILQFSAAIFAAVNREKFVNSLKDVLEKCGADPKTRSAIKPIQELFKCCGATEATKHFFVEEKLCADNALPDCFDVLNRSIEESGETIVVIAFVLVAIQVFALIFSCFLCRASREVQYAGLYA